MKRIISALFVMGSAMALAGCAGGLSTTGVVAPTTSSAVAPVAQKNDVIAWASACDGWDNLKSNLTIFEVNKKVPPKDNPTITKVVTATDPLCTAYPVNLSAATSTVLASTSQLITLVPGLGTSPITSALITTLGTKAPTTK